MDDYEKSKLPDISGLFGVSENLLTTKCKAKYAVSPEGELKLLSIQEFSEPRFSPKGWESRRGESGKLVAEASSSVGGSDEDLTDDIALEVDEREKFANLCRASRRAKIGAFDLIQCNPDLDAFVTLTLDPSRVRDRADWDCAYGAIKVWLANRVQRNDLKYVLVSEWHKNERGIHFHSLMNSSALNLIEARYPTNGRLIKDKGQQVYNIADYTAGFSTAKIITGENATDKVSKYIFKYMGKQFANKIGGRYYLHGGKLRRPIYRYSDDPEDLLIPGAVPTFTKEVEITSNLKFKEWCYV